MSRHKNRLAGETSPYLLQHAGNPVDWFPWGDEALALARKLDRPILLSIGYAACHWCHVMERESFENDAIARLMNDHFVNIKVDREERPDLDDIYMAATTALTGSGGWPMTVFLTPDQEPFFAGTYFPPEDRYGRPGFPSLLERIAELWKNDRNSLLAQAAELTEHVRAGSREAPPGAITRDALRLAYRALARDFDPAFGGFGRAPKFPPSAALSLLLRYHRLSGEPHALAMVRATLDGMKNGGIYDQLGGGFARYSVDEGWLVPHFEKMLYDNAQLADVYLEAFAATSDGEYRRIARETLDYVVREMQSPSGGYFSSSDADSEGVEGKYFVWSADEINAALEAPFAERFSHFYGVLPEGNWEGTNVLHTPRSLEMAARDLGVPAAELAVSLEHARAELLAVRETRVPPAIDDKVLVAWNGLMIRAMANGYRQLRDPAYLESAQRAADFIATALTRPDGGLYRTARAGHAHLDAYLEDYAYLSDGLLSLYEAGGRASDFERALALAERMLGDFGDGDGAFFQTAHQHEKLITRVREGHDGALPNPNAVACRVLARLAAHTGRDDLRKRAIAAAMAYGNQVKRVPRAFASLLGAVDFLLEPPLEVVLTGDPSHENYEELAGAVAARYLPNRVEAHVADGSDAPPTPLVEGKLPVDGKPALYLCENFTCQAPVTDPDALGSLLEAADERLRAAAKSELGRERLEGRARRLATARHRDESALGAENFAPLGDDGEAPLVSRIGFGGYRSGLDVPDHRASLRHALLNGVNLIDTSPTFALGDSERLVGEVVSELVEEEKLTRDAVVIVSKVGLAQGADRERLTVRQRDGRPYRHFAILGETGDEQAPAACFDPEWIETSITASLDRLGLTHLDVCLLQNPEHLLATGSPDERAAFRAALHDAFDRLETEVKAGRIGRYGVATNAAGGPPDRRVDISELLDVAHDVAGDGHHFAVVEVPINLLETGALDGEPSFVAAARRAGLAVLAARPLNAISDEALIRLADPPPMDPDGTSAEVARRSVAELEGHFESTLAPALRAAGVIGPEALFTFGGRMGEAVERAVTTEQFDHLEATILTPRVRTLLGELDRAFAGPQQDLWTSWRGKYVAAMGRWLAAARGKSAEGNRRILSEIESKLRTGALKEHWDESLGGISWSKRALGLVRSLNGVTSVLVGMRSLAHVDEALESLRVELPALDRW